MYFPSEYVYISMMVFNYVQIMQFYLVILLMLVILAFSNILVLQKMTSLINVSLYTCLIFP